MTRNKEKLPWIYCGHNFNKTPATKVNHSKNKATKQQMQYLDLIMWSSACRPAVWYYILVQYGRLLCLDLLYKIHYSLILFFIIARLFAFTILLYIIFFCRYVSVKIFAFRVKKNYFYSKLYLWYLCVRNLLLLHIIRC